MDISKLSNILKIVRGSEPSEEERQSLYKETLLMTLSRASTADANISPVEVETVQAIVKRVTGEDVSAADVRIAAASELYETGRLDHYLSHAARQLASEQRVEICEALAEVIRSDVKVTTREVEFFNTVASALKVTPAELVGLNP
jgi:uncharacterized tellurite resistance protein B-like protein